MVEQRGADAAKGLPEAVLGKAIQLAKKPGLVPRKLGFDLGLFDPENQSVYILNATAAAVWDNLTTSRSYWDVSSGMALSYRLDSEAAKEIAKDVHSIVARWKSDGLLMSEREAEAWTARPGDRPEIIPFPEREVSRVTSDYQRPMYSIFTVGELRERYKLEDFPLATPFADTWL
jgi:hypothetical protein